MSRTVFCRKYQKEMPGLAIAPLPGPRGEEIFEQVSEQAWLEWQALQTMLINEKALNLRDAESRKYLTEQMARFFDNQETDHAQGFTPKDA